jgi:hypothetical protein
VCFSKNGTGVLNEAGDIYSITKLGDQDEPPRPLCGGALMGSGAPVCQKKKQLGSRTGWTSPASVAARQTALMNIPVRKRAPTSGNAKAYAPNLASFAGRALPTVGLGLNGLDIAVSDDPWRTAAGNALGTLVGGAGAALCSPSLLGIGACGVGGSYTGNKAGLFIYGSLGGE